MLPLSTKSTCPACGRPVPAEILQEGDDLFLESRCPEHGTNRRLFWKDARLYEASRRLEDGALLPEGSINVAGGAADGFLTTFAIDVTTRCNMDCPTCVTNASRTPPPDPTKEALLSWIPDFNGRRFRPNISLVGGESTLREDLPELIRGIRAKGLEPRLNTNGLLLADPGRLRRLSRAGLRWVILQFDGLTPAPSVAFRGKDYSRLKIDIIRGLREAGFLVHLAVMIQKGVNDHEMGDILRFAMKEPCVRRVSFYPRSWIGRVDDPTAEPTHVADLLAALESTTQGDVTPEDILASKALGRRLFWITRHAMFRPRTCIYPFLLMRRGDRILPVVRLLRPGRWIRDPSAALKLAGNVINILRYDEGRFSGDILFVNIEKFYDHDAFDLQGARNCHHIYITAGGFYPFCIYNTYHRNDSPETPAGSACR